MLILLTALDANQQLRNFTWWFDDLEVCLDVLNKLSAQGNQFLRIELIDKDKHTTLPVEAFEGTSSPMSIEALGLEWQQILDYPAT